jgi:hypothetical protein
MWAGIIFLHPLESSRNYLYVVACVVVVVGWSIASEILWHKRHPRLSRKISEIHTRQDKLEGRAESPPDAEDISLPVTRLQRRD